MKSKYYNRSKPQRLGIAKNFFTIVEEDASVKEVLGKKGFTADKIESGKLYYKEANKDFCEVEETITSKKELSAEFRTEFDSHSKEFSTLFGYSKLLFENNKEVTYMLGLNIPKEKSITHIFNSINQFFANVFNSEFIIEQLKKYDYSVETLHEFEENYKRVYKLYLTFKHEEEEVFEKNTISNQKMELLDNFMIELISVGVIIEKTIPNFLRKMGIIL